MKLNATESADRVVHFHSIPMDFMLPGILPTGKRVEIAFVAVVQFEGDKLVQEHLYWDQASVLVQLGLIDLAGLPVVGAEGARSVLDRSIPLNALINRANSTKSNPTSTRLKNMGLSAQESDSAALRR